MYCATHCSRFPLRSSMVNTNTPLVVDGLYNTKSPPFRVYQLFARTHPAGSSQSDMPRTASGARMRLRIRSTFLVSPAVTENVTERSPWFGALAVSLYEPSATPTDWPATGF